MENVRPKQRAWLPLVFACATIGLIVPQPACAQTNSSPSWWPFGHSSPPPPPPPPADDAISLKTPAKVGVELYVAVAAFYVQNGKYEEAEEQYKQAVKMAPDDIRVLLGYAILKDHMRQPEEAMKFYKRALEKYPKHPAVHNDLAVHYAKHDMLREAIDAARHAVELRPGEARYRNNLAALYVEAGQLRAAFKELREVYDDATAHYNLGFLLNKRGLKAAALQEFTIALRFNPRMTLAQQWVERLSRERGDENPLVVGMMPTPAPVYAQNPGYPRAETIPPPPAAPVLPQYVTQSPPAALQSPAAQTATVLPPRPDYPLPQQPAAPQNSPAANGLNPAAAGAAAMPQPPADPVQLPPPATQTSPTAYAPTPESPHGESLPAPPSDQPPPAAQAQFPASAPAPAPAPFLPPLPAPYQAPYLASTPPPTQLQDPTSSQPLVRIQYPAPSQGPALPPDRAQFAAPQVAGPQVSGPQSSANLPPPEGSTRAASVAARDPSAVSFRPTSPPADAASPQRLPPVSEQKDAADSNLQGSETAAPDPPDLRR